MGSRVLAGRYELLEQIGEGGMAVVYKARCRVLNRYVAIKILKPEFTKDLKLVEKFKKESQAAASLVHPNIVGVYDVGKEGNINYIVMELVEGKILSDMIKENGPFDYKKAIDITQQIARGLSCAHKNHIIHKDVKPHNILLTTDGVAKITDFGIAKFVDNATIVGNTDTVMGSVHYFSPEQARGGYVDEKSDIYSLGIVLYEMITGTVPFDGENPVTVALMHINDEIIPPSKVVNGVPPVLEQIIMKATNKIQVNRFKSADEMADALKNVDLISSIVGEATYLKVGKTEREPEVGRDSAADGEGINKAKKESATDMKKNGKKKVRLNKVKIAAIIIALVCAIPVSGLIYALVSGFVSVKEVEVPDLSGQTVEEATKALEDLGLKIETGDQVYDSTYGEGEIVSQSPEADSKVKEGKTITVNISKGAKEGTIPNLVGKSYEDAVFLIEKYGFKVGSVTTGKSEMPKDVVISQSPEGGEEASPREKINFVVSEGRAEGEVTMPSLIGKDIDTATSDLQKLGLAVGDIGYDMSQAYNKNQVMWQQYGADETVMKGTKVNLKVSTGTEPAGPKSIALDVDFSEAKNLVFFLTVTVSDETGTFNVISREQRLKDDLGEVVSFTGTGQGTVTVIFDNDVVMKKSVNFNTGEIN
ncbi:Stk1 family PASTA domain-containing Ser/Thr kinase [Clostridium aminobutyricum]|uniref:non-specific serine/threonine protein kinase n=1 Tax=Clostridium aminobutyricum TaxID=33953 RepID=A0A939D6P6_CLOAM|nr:Stk1 family PASTA domain-containing Ser/Thr kinase [Clostridium aminobutyricum]MBN7772051.1 Stk1 family PASTA domain-containing Ser/Thr kinase [Clostridium aminobutyricum]